MFRGQRWEVDIRSSLAYCELYLAMAYMFRRFDIREDPKK